MDESTISDIRQRVARWQTGLKNGKDSERTWIFAVNIDDAELLLATIARLEVDNEALQKENTELRLVIMGMRESIAIGIDPGKPGSDQTVYVTAENGEILIRLGELPADSIQHTPNGTPLISKQYLRAILDGSALEPDAPTGLSAYWFEVNTGPYKADDTAMQRSHPWSRGPFGSWNEANDEWKKFLKRERENGQP